LLQDGALTSFAYFTYIAALRFMHSDVDSIGHGGTCPHFYKWLGTEGVPWIEEQQRRNWLNCTDHHESAHQNY